MSYSILKLPNGFKTNDKRRPYLHEFLNDGLKLCLKPHWIIPDRLFDSLYGSVVFKLFFFFFFKWVLPTKQVVFLTRVKFVKL